MSGYTTTPNYALRKPVVGADTDIWGGDWNQNADTLDSIIKTNANSILNYLPLAGGTMTGPLNLTATGTTTSRSQQARAAEIVNVKDFGARIDGVTDDTAAFSAARAVVAPALNGRVFVPQGTMGSITNVTIPPNTSNIWELQAGTSAGFNVFHEEFGTDIVHAINGGEFWYQRNTALPPGNSAHELIRVGRRQTHSGGNGWAAVSISDTLYEGANPGGQTTALAITTTAASTTAAGATQVGLQAQSWRDAGSPHLYAANIGVGDRRGDVTDRATMVCCEFGISGNGDWSVGPTGIGAHAINLDLVANKGVATNTIFIGNYGVRVTNNAGDLSKGGYETPFHVGTTNVYVSAFGGVATIAPGAVGFDASNMNFADAIPVAMRLGTGGAVDVTDNSANYLQYTTTGTPRLRYVVGATEAWSVSDNGGLSIPTSLAPNVRFYGATLNGVAFDDAAYQAARTVTGINGSVSVPYGRQRLSIAPTGGPATQVLWRLDGTYIGTAGGNPVLGIGTDVVENFFGGNKYFGRSNSFAAVGPVLRVDSTVNHAGGTAGAVISTLRVNTTTSSSAVETCFGISSVVTDNRAVGNAMALAAYTVRNTARPNNLSYGLNTYVTDTTGLASSAAGAACGAEVDIIANGLDDGGLAGPFGVPAGAGIRTVFQAVGDAYNDGLADCEIGWGIRVTPSNGKSNVIFKRMFAAEGRYSKAVFSTEFATPDSTSAHAILLATGHRIAFDTAGTRTLYYDSSSGKLFFAVSGVTQFSIDANGNMRCAGTVTGSVTP